MGVAPSAFGLRSTIVGIERREEIQYVGGNWTGLHVVSCSDYMGLHGVRYAELKALFYIVRTLVAIYAS